MKDQQQVRTKILNRYSLRTKLTLGVILIFAFFGYFCIYWFGEFYKKDKIAYLFDLQASNSLRLSELAKISLSNQGQQVGLKNSSRQLFEPSDQNSLRNLKLEGLKRLPGENEFFALFLGTGILLKRFLIRAWLILENRFIFFYELFVYQQVNEACFAHRRSATHQNSYVFSFLCHLCSLKNSHMLREYIYELK